MAEKCIFPEKNLRAFGGGVPRRTIAVDGARRLSESAKNQILRSARAGPVFSLPKIKIALGVPILSFMSFVIFAAKLFA